MSATRIEPTHEMHMKIIRKSTRLSLKVREDKTLTEQEQKVKIMGICQRANEEMLFMYHPELRPEGQVDLEEEDEPSELEQEEKPSVFDRNPELKKMIEEMYESIGDHVDVFPDAPGPNDIVIPTGRLALCQCSIDCTKELPQPEYTIISKDDQRWMLDDNDSKSSAKGQMAKKGVKVVIKNKKGKRTK